MLPESWRPVDITVPQVLDSTILVTVHPEHIARTALSLVHTVVAIGNPAAVFDSFAKTLQIPAPPIETENLSTERPWYGLATVTTLHSGYEQFEALGTSCVTSVATPKENSPGNKASISEGLESKLNLRAQNLIMFLQLADGEDDDTWMYHLRAGDYSKWFYATIKDRELGAQTEQIERDEKLSPEESRRRIREAVEKRYTAAA